MVWSFFQTMALAASAAPLQEDELAVPASQASP